MAGIFDITASRQNALRERMLPGDRRHTPLAVHLIIADSDGINRLRRCPGLLLAASSVKSCGDCR
jgi:hypothetical protein